MPDRIERIESMAILLDLVASGRGVTILPALAARADLAVGRVATLPLAASTRLTWSLVGHALGAGLSAPLELANMFQAAIRSGDEA